jgi:hypothetical protein
MLKNSLFLKLLKKVQMQGGAGNPHSAVERWAFFSSLVRPARPQGAAGPAPFRGKRLDRGACGP